MNPYVCKFCMHQWHMPGGCTSPSELRCECGDDWIAEVRREAAEIAFTQGASRALTITRTRTSIGDGLFTVIGNPYRQEGGE